MGPQSVQKSRTGTYDMSVRPSFYPVLMEHSPRAQVSGGPMCVGVHGDSQRIQAKYVLPKTKEVGVGRDPNSPKRSPLPDEPKLASVPKAVAP